MPLDLSKFMGAAVDTGSPRLYVKNHIDSIFDHYLLTMTTPLLVEEALEIGEMLGVDESVVRDNFDHMAGTTRCLFELDLKTKSGF